MSFDTIQRSIQDSAPVELYEWTAVLPNLYGVSQPNTPGPLVISDDLDYPDYASASAAGWSGHGFLDGQSSVCECGSPCSSPNKSCFGFSGGGFVTKSRFQGGIGDAGGYHYLEKTFVLDPFTEYEVRAMVRKLTPGSTGFRQYGMSINSADGSGAGDDWSFAIVRGTTDGTGNLNIKFGEYDLEYGMGLLTLQFRDLSIYTTAGGGGTPEGSTTITDRLTSADRPFVFQGETFLPAMLHRTALHKGSGETSASELTVTAPRAMDLVQQFFAVDGTPSAILSLRLIRVESSDPTTYAVAFIGEAVKGDFSGASIEILCLSPEAKMKKKIPSILNQKECPWFTYDQDCRVDPGTFAMTDAEVLDIDATGKIITIDGLSAFYGTDTTYFVNGVLIRTDGSRAYIESQVGETIVLQDPMPSLIVGDLVTLVAGDDFTMNTCASRFNNAIRFGGTMVGMATKNPFEVGMQ